MFSELHREYQRLREALEAAYRAPVWDTQRIDRLADALARIERRAVSRPAGLAAPFRSWPKADPAGSTASRVPSTHEAVSR